MDHPLVDLNQKDLRQRVVQLLKSSYNARRASNIIFVCGGNKAGDMRMRFRDFCTANLSDFEVFLPEYAIENILAIEQDEPFDLADFEELVSELSHAIVIFPEAAGSYAETGYFSAFDKIMRRCILVLDSQHQGKDSFISLGPAKKIGSKTIFFPVIQTNYQDPDFNLISEKISRIKQKQYKKSLSFEKYRELTKYEFSCLIHQIINLLTIATLDDLLFILKVIFRNSFSVPDTKKLLSVLIGAEYISYINEYGHMHINPEKPKLLAGISHIASSDEV